MKSTWRSWLFPNIIFLSSKCGASPPGWATWEITEFPTHQQYKIDVYINLYSSGKLLTLGWETNHIVGNMVVDEGRMKSTWRSWLFPNIIFLSSKCGASPPGWATWEITEFPTHQQYKIDVYINLYSSGKLLTLGWETNHIVVIAGVLEIPWFPGWPNQVVRHHT